MAEGCKLANVFATLLAVASAHAQDTGGELAVKPLPQQVAEVVVGDAGESFRRSPRRVEPPKGKAPGTPPSEK